LSLPVVREHTDAVIEALKALSDYPVGDAVAPPGDPAAFYTLYHIAGGNSSGNLGAPNDDAALIFQVTCVSKKSREQVEWLADKAYELLNNNLIVSGRKINRVDLEMFGGVQRDDKTEPPTYWITPRFRVFSTPA
jgi:hypothetical protein